MSWNMEKRGILTEELTSKYGIDTTLELRLIPYYQYLVINSLPINPNAINSSEREILARWKEEGKIDYSMSYPCSCSREFWDYMNNVLWDSYAIHMDEEL